MQQRSSNAIYFILLLTPLLWGGAFGATKHVVTELPPMTASAVRFLLAALILIPWAVLRGEWSWSSLRRHWLALTLFGGSGVFLYNYFFATGLKYTSAITGALIVVVNPVITALIATMFLGEVWNRRLGFGVLLSLCGVLVVISQGDFSQFARQSLGKGELLMLGGMFSWSAYTLIGKLVLRSCRPLFATTASTLIGALLLFAASLAEGSWHLVPHISLQSKLELVYLAVFATVLAFILYNIGISRIGASRASAYINLMPVCAVFIAWALYGETVTAMHGLGMLAVVSGVFLTTQSPTHK